MASCEIIQTKEAKGIDEKYADRIKEIEAKALENHLKDVYIICLFDGGQEMSSPEFARFLDNVASRSSRGIAFVTGGFLGLSKKILEKADFLLSLSKMTFSHELSRVILLEQIYRALTLLGGRQYAK